MLLMLRKSMLCVEANHQEETATHDAEVKAFWSMAL
jgi:hypothetical protein